MIFKTFKARLIAMGEVFFFADGFLLWFIEEVDKSYF